MQQLSWIESLTTVMNLDEVDHKKLLEFANQLSRALEAANVRHDFGGCFEKRPIALAIDRLKDQTMRHCAAEELHFFQTGFSCLDSRRQQHLELIDRVTNMAEQFDAATAPQAAMEIAERIHDWVFAHVYGAAAGAGRTNSPYHRSGTLA